MINRPHAADLLQRGVVLYLSVSPAVQQNCGSAAIVTSAQEYWLMYSP